MKTIQLTIKERKITFTLGILFVGEMLEQYDLTISELLEKVDRNPFKWLPKTMYESAKTTFELDGKKIDFEYLEFVDMLESVGGVGSQEAADFTVAFIKSMVHNVPLEEEQEQEDEQSNEEVKEDTKQKKS